MNQHIRTFEATDAVRSEVPLLVGLSGPSNGGKTYSGLRLATGIQQVTGGDIWGIDTEARRMLHYADMFKFKHMPFRAPFGSLDYLAALQHCVKNGAKVIIVDSMSHEHEGPGGLLDFHLKELDRLAGEDWAKRERVNMLAWQKPKQARRQLINGILQMEANFIFCFRSKNTAKPIKKDGKSEVVQLGYMPIAGEEFVFEQTVNCLLLPGAKGVPTWSSGYAGEKQMIKLPEQFRGLFADNKPLDEEIGRKLALWARGGDAPPAPKEDSLLDDGRAAATNGTEELKTWWKKIGQAARQRLGQATLDTLKAAAKQADDSAPSGEDVPFDDDAPKTVPAS